MLTSRITEGKKKKNHNFKSPLCRSVFASVGQFTLMFYTLDFVWLLYLSYNFQMNKEKR